MIAWDRVSWRELFAGVILLGATIAAGLIFFALPHPWWGERHLPHDDAPGLMLTGARILEQTFTFERPTLDTIVIWIEKDSTLREDEELVATVQQGEEVREQVLALRDVPPSGVVVIPVSPPLQANTGAQGMLQLKVKNPQQRVNVLIQRDASKYPAGQLTWKNNPQDRGDVAFQLQYTAPALGQPWQTLYSGAILIAGLVVAGMMMFFPGTLQSLWQKGDGKWAAGVGLLITLFYGFFLLRPGYWLGPDDYVKDVAYFTESSAALAAFTWPEWAHIRCGGMPLLGNPEGNALSLGTLLSLAIAPEHALLLLLALEAGISAGGTFLVARSCGLERLASLAAAAVAGLAGAFPYRLAEGWMMIGGAVAWIPWVLLAMLHTLKHRSWPWALLTSVFLAAMFFRGDIHIIVGLIFILGLWALIVAAQERSWQPLALLVGLGAATFLWGSVKVLPYLEQTRIVAPKIPPYSVLLTKAGLLDDALLKTHSPAIPIPVEHAQKPERWGSFGAYIGPVTLGLALVGMFGRWPHRKLIVGGALLALALSEGSLFEYALRHFGVLSTLLRIPSKQFAIFIVFVAVLAAAGLQKLLQCKKQHTTLIAVIVLTALTGDLSFTSGRLLRSEFNRRTHHRIAPASQPMLGVHAPFEKNPDQFVGLLVQAGYFLPGLCGEPYAQPVFTQTINQHTPVTPVRASTAPNTITVEVDQISSEIPIRTLAAPAWRASTGFLLPAEDESMTLVVPKNAPQTITLTYRTATASAQQILFIMFMMCLLLFGAQRIHRYAKEHGGQTHH